MSNPRAASRPGTRIRQRRARDWKRVDDTEMHTVLTRSASRTTPARTSAAPLHGRDQPAARVDLNIRGA
jgi:hypothetical protein